MGYRSKIHLKIQKYRRRILEYKQKPCNYGFLFPQLHGLLYFNSLPDLLRKQHHNLITSLYKRCHLFRIQWLMCQHCQIIQLFADNTCILAALMINYILNQRMICIQDQCTCCTHIHSAHASTSSSFPAYGGSLQIMSS